jgi:protein-disulfide isomerase
MNSHVARIALVCVAAAAFNACGRKADPPSKVAARIGGKAISLDAVDENVRSEIFELRSMALHSMVVRQLLADDARKRGIDMDELRRREVDEKVPTPPEAEVRDAVREWVAMGRVTEQAAAQMSPSQAAERLRHVRMRDREEAYYDELFHQSAVQFDFAALGKPELKVTSDGPALGPDNAKIVVFEFADLTQKFTALWQPTLERLVEKYRGSIRFVFKQKPGNANAPAAEVAEAALCANEQGHYWEFRKALFQPGAAVNPQSVAAAASKSGLNMPAFEGCMRSGKTRPTVAHNIEEARANGLEGEPVVSINGIRLSGAHPFAAVDRLLRIETGTL